MDWIFARLVTILAAICLFLGLSACQMLAEDLPKSIRIHDRFSDTQTEAIQKAIDEWNEVGREYLGYDTIIYEGRHSDSDGFSPKENAKDGYNVIYKMEKSDKWYDYLYSMYIGNKHSSYEESAYILGFATVGDILMFDFSIVKGDDDLEDREKTARYYHRLQYSTTHELGHWLGMLHIGFTYDDGTKPLMYPEATNDEIAEMSGSFITNLDIQAFCLIYDCVKQP